MKRCQKLSAKFYVLVLASLFLFTSCGIPNFLNLDDAISWGKISTNNNTKLDVTLTIFTRGIEKITEVNTKPSIKFFYVLSTNSSTSAPPANREKVDSLYDFRYNLTYVPSLFSNYKGKLGNGISWSPESNTTAPGFYLYTKDDSTYRNFARMRSGVIDAKPDELGILVGTFAQGSSLLDKPNAYNFSGIPFMDTQVPISGGGDLTFNFTLELAKESSSSQIAIEFKNVTEGKSPLYFASYKRNLFPHSSDASDIETFRSEDPYFHQPIYNEINDKPDANLYLHIWATVFGGDGTFTNIYWSNLEYLGFIQLF